MKPFIANILSKLALSSKGKKTIAATIALTLVELGNQYGIAFDPEITKSIEIILGALIVIFLRSGVKKAEK